MQYVVSQRVLTRGGKLVVIALHKDERLRERLEEIAEEESVLGDLARSRME